MNGDPRDLHLLTPSFPTDALPILVHRTAAGAGSRVGTALSRTARPPFVDPRSAMAAAQDGPGWMKPAPPREGCRVVPLIEAADMYPALEHLQIGRAHV